MLRIESALRGYAIEAVDGRIGSLADFLFDDATWRLRWLVVDTDGWLSGRKILIRPSVIGAPDNALQTLSVKLTKAKISSSPAIPHGQNVSRGMERELCDYYGWEPPMPLPGHDTPSSEPDPHLRSIAAISGFHIVGTDRDVGHLENMVIDDRDWAIRYLVINTRNWWFGSHIRLATSAVTKIDPSSNEIRLNVSSDGVKAGPAFAFATGAMRTGSPDAALPSA